MEVVWEIGVARPDANAYTKNRDQTLKICVHKINVHKNQRTQNMRTLNQRTLKSTYTKKIFMRRH